MKFALFGINNGPCTDPDTIRAVAIEAERSGFESVWTGEHVVLPDPQVPPSPAPPLMPMTHPSTALAFIAAVTETLKRSDAEGFAAASLDRIGLWAMETPQVFGVPLIRSAYEKVLADGVIVTDEVSALQHAGKKVLLVENRTPNPKITYPSDLALASALLISD